jgi:hypothetical protein
MNLITPKKQLEVDKLTQPIHIFASLVKNRYNDILLDIE